MTLKWNLPYPQSRTKGDELFNKSYAEYDRGFGDVSGDHWLGLQAVYQLCPQVGGITI